MSTTPSSGLVSIRSRHSVDDTVARLTAILAEKGIKLFALIDHSGEAVAAGLSMPPTKLAIFGNSKAGTPAMLAAPSIALDLPLKLLIAEDAHGHVHLTYNAPAFLRDRHHLPADLMVNLAAIETIARAVAE
jgi:uncharacterized protein (DUF302 family)